MKIIDNDLLFNEWDKGKNEELGLDPEKLSMGSNKYAFWNCHICGYEWKAMIAKRGLRGQGCPQCAKKMKGQKQVSKKIAVDGSLATRYPELIIEWDYVNNDSSPEQFLPGSNKKVNWQCRECGYKWKAQIIKRTTRNQGCPECGKIKNREGQKQFISERILKEGSMGSLHPELVKEWDFKNNNMSPYDYLEASNQKVFWICSACGYRWKTSISNRSKGHGCPKCGQEIGKKNLLKRLINEKGSLEDNRPDLISEWDYEKNASLCPADVMLYSNKVAWWKCKKCGYSWKSQIGNRTNGQGCPRCTYINVGGRGNRVLTGINDLQSQDSLLAMEWHPVKNTDLKPSEVACNSNKKVWWLGKCGHEWEAGIASRFNGRGCPLCRKEFRISYPEKVLFYYLKKYLPVFVEENYKAEWLNGKEIDIFIPELKFGIEYDGGNWHKDPNTDAEKNELCRNNGITLLRIRETGLPQINDFDSYTINVGTEKDDEIIKAVNYIFSYIKEKFTIVCDYNINLSTDRTYIYELMEMNRKEKSLKFLYPDIACEWNEKKNGRIKPEYVNAHSHRRYWWICPLGHEYEMVVKHRVEKKIQCPICSNHRVLTGFNDLATKRPDVAALWNNRLNKELKPTEISEYSNKKVWWTCEQGHDYMRKVCNQSLGKMTCPVCSKKKNSVNVV